MPIIPPLLENDEIVFDYAKKAELFNDYFANQCTPLDNASVLPPFEYKTLHRLSTFSITNEMIINIIRSLDPNKSSGWDNISSHMIKICDSSIYSWTTEAYI